MTCRDEVLDAARAIAHRNGADTFGLADVLAEMRRRQTAYAESTIRTHVVSKMTINAPAHHGSRSSDFEALGAGMYRLLGGAG